MFRRLLQAIPGLSWSPPRDTYFRSSPLVLINGLAEQSESWYRNREVLQRDFDVHAPGVLVYDGPVMQRRLADGLPISVAFLKDRLAEYLDNFVQTPPYHLVASSLGAQVAVEDAAQLHHRLLTEAFVPAFNGIVARVVLHYHLSRCGLPAVIFDPAVDRATPTDEPSLTRRLMHLIAARYDEMLGE